MLRLAAARVVVIARAKSVDEADPWIESQQKTAAAARNGSLVRAVGSGHDIELEKPEVVVTAIRALVERIPRPGR